MTTLMLACVLISVAAAAVAGDRWRRLARTRQVLAAAQHQATHDQLTGLRNRAGLAAAWPTTTGGGQAAVAVIDLDGFKPINDQHGHAAGDQVLTEVAARLTRLVPGVVARLGGDEFAAVWTCPTPHHTAQTLAQAIAAPIQLDTGHTVTVTASIGVTAPAGADLGTALAHADAAMYRAKHHHRYAPVAVYHPHVDDRPHPAADPRPNIRVRDMPGHRSEWQIAA